MNQRMLPHRATKVTSSDTNPLGYHSLCSNSASEQKSLPLAKELTELCAEIAGALLRGYAEGELGHAVRKLLVDGLKEKMNCSLNQAQALVDLSLELIHVEAYGRSRRSDLEFSLLIARSGGGVRDASDN